MGQFLEHKKRSGRPRKAEHEKVQYQRIAVYAEDYEMLSLNLQKRNRIRPKEERIKLTDAFTDMVVDYIKNK